MEKYARASGHPRLVELLSRHASDQKDKFTLSDDEDQARAVAYGDRRMNEEVRMYVAPSKIGGIPRNPGTSSGI